MATLLLKKSYRHKDLKEVKFNDLWNAYGVFTTMRVLGRSAKILFYKSHIDNLIKSLNLPINREIRPITANPKEAPKLIIKKYIPTFEALPNNPVCSLEK